MPVVELAEPEFQNDQKQLKDNINQHFTCFP